MEWNQELCQLDHRISYVWTLLSDDAESSDDNSDNGADVFAGGQKPLPNTLMWYSDLDVEDIVIPDLQQQLVEMQHLVNNTDPSLADEVSAAYKKIPILEVRHTHHCLRPSVGGSYAFIHNVVLQSHTSISKGLYFTHIYTRVQSKAGSTRAL